MYTVVMLRRAQNRVKRYEFKTPDGRTAFCNYAGWIDRELHNVSQSSSRITTRIVLLSDTKVVRQIRLQTI